MRRSSVSISQNLTLVAFLISVASGHLHSPPTDVIWVPRVSSLGSVAGQTGGTAASFANLLGLGGSTWRGASRCFDFNF